MNYASLLFLIFFASVKFFLSAPLAILQYKLEIWESVLYLTLGGWAGVFAFAFLSRQISSYVKQLNALLFDKFSKQPRKKFSFKRRAMVKIKVKYGLPGIAILTPVFISIPFGAFIAQHYYPGKKSLYWLMASVLGWAVVLSTIYTVITQLSVA